MNEDFRIPDNWKVVTFEDISEGKNAIVDGPFGSNLKTSDYINDKVNGIPVLTTKNLEGNYSDEKVRFISREKFEELKRSQVNPGDILVAKIGSIGKTGIYPKNARTAIIPANLLKFTVSKKVNFNYVFYYLNSSGLQNRIKKISTATAQPAFNLTKFRKLRIPLPPFVEQQAIVSKIEELLSDLENGKQQLQTSLQQLKVYRQSLLKWAFEGRLTSTSLSNRQNSRGLSALIERSRDEAEAGELPNGWKWVKINEITSVLGDGLHGTPKYTDSGEYFFINGNNLNDGKIEIKENTKRVSYTEYDKHKKPLNEKTIFVSINGSIGYTAFYNGEKVILGKSACYLNVLESINKQYVRYCFLSQRFINYANKYATGSTIKNVGLKAMREFEIPLPPSLDDQQNIVNELESKLTVCDKIEEIISQSLQQSETLRQSIFKKAFEGKLV